MARLREVPRWRWFPSSVMTAAVVTAMAVMLWPAGPIYPQLGSEVELATRSCSTSLVDGTPRAGKECGSWSQAGPVNVMVVFHNRSPYEELTHQTPWRPASGKWLVMQARTHEKFKGCGDDWRDDKAQVQLRLDKVTRRHWKMILEQCTQADGTRVVFGQAHTDKYDVGKCHGDYAIDWDQARDALADAYRSLPNTSVELRHVTNAKKYPGGCNTMVQTDGQVLYVDMKD